MNSEEAVSQLTAMGFEEAQAQEALTVANGNIDQAVNILLGGGGASNISTAQQSSDSSLILCSTSQYNVENGRSACTCIALMGAVLFLSSQEKDPSTELLQTMIHQGVAAYHKLPTNNNVEHLSAEEVLQSNVIEEFKSLSLLPGGVRQGVLSGNSNHPLGLHALLEECHSCLNDNTCNDWMAVLITKPPETILVLLSRTGPYILLDSHPRPGLEGSHARIHASLDDLIQSLQEIFPLAELGPDVPEMMTMMYNSFDVYPLVWNEQESGES